jgi:hypothetical protein
MSGDGDGERCEREGKIYLVVWGITGGVRGYSVPSLWVPWTQPQGYMVHCSLAGTDCSSHCDRGTGWTRAMPSSLHSSPLCTGALSDWSL